MAKTFDSPADQPIVKAVEAVTSERRDSMAEVALAWVLRHPVVAAPVIGASKPHHEVRRLEEPYLPQAPYWY